MRKTSEQWDAGLNTHNQRNIRPIKFYALFWSISFVAAVLFLPLGDGTRETQPIWAWLLAAIPVIPGTLLAHHYLRFIRETDELMRKLHLEALAAGFGVAFVFGTGFILLGQLEMTKFTGLTWHLMLLTYIWKLRSAQREYSE